MELSIIGIWHIASVYILVAVATNIANPCSKLLCTEVKEVYQISRKHY